MKHLKRSTSGHLLKTPSGHLAKSCSDAAGPCSVDCDTVDLDPGVECCVHDFDGSSIVDPPPETFTFHATNVVSSGVRDWDTAPPYHIFQVDASGLTGMSFPLPFDHPCAWIKTFDVTGLVKILRCNGDGTGPGACTPTADILSSATLTISYTPGTTPDIRIDTTSDDTEWDTGAGRELPISTSGLKSFINCCTEATGSDPALDGSESPLVVQFQEWAVTPC